MSRLSRNGASKIRSIAEMETTANTVELQIPVIHTKRSYSESAREGGGSRKGLGSVFSKPRTMKVNEVVRFKNSLYFSPFRA